MSSEEINSRKVSCNEDIDSYMEVSRPTNMMSDFGCNKRFPSNSDLSKQDLINKLNEYRKSNIELLEDKRHLLLRSQEAYKIEVELENTKEEMLQLRKRVNALENTPQDIATNTIKELARQLSNTSKKSNESNEETVNINFNGCEGKEKLSEKRVSDKEKLQLSLNMSDENTICHCGASNKLQEVIQVNHYWQQDYTALSDECKNLKARVWKLESEIRIVKQENINLLKQKNTLHEEQEERFVNDQIKDSKIFTVDDIEALKQQSVIYKEDYMQEVKESKKLNEELNKLKLELQKAYGVIDGLTLKNNTIKQNFRRISTEKEHIINELRRLSNTNVLPLSPAAAANRFPRVESLESIHSEDIIARTAPNIRIPEFFFGGRVERDGKLQNNVYKNSSKQQNNLHVDDSSI